MVSGLLGQARIMNRLRGPNMYSTLADGKLVERFKRVSISGDVCRGEGSKTNERVTNSGAAFG